MSEKQLSRLAGVPRLPLPIWKAAAASFFVGKDPTREEQQNQGRKTKVKLLRELAASDPAVRSWAIKFASDFRARDARKTAAEQGLSMPEKLGFVPLFPGDRPDLSVMARTVICMEKPNADELLAKLQTLYPDGDPPEVAEREAAAILEIHNSPYPCPVIHGCNICGFRNGNATREVNGAYYCNEHPSSRPEVPAPSVPTSPASYINRAFGKRPLDPNNPADNRILTLEAIKDAQAYHAPTNRPMVGPVPADAVFINRRD